jgi:transmembrane sensor
MPRDVEPSSAELRQAAWEWVVRHDRGLTGSEQRAFASWRDGDPRHAVEFARAATSWDRLGRIRQAPRLREAADAVLRHTRSRARRRWFELAGGALLAAAAIALAYVGPWVAPRMQEAEPNYRVLASAARNVQLPDGSSVLLNGDSRIETVFTASERRVWLRQGEALFTVAKNPARPFFVTAGPVTIRAVGTAFNVQMDPGAINVLVTEGRVRLDAGPQGGSLLPAAQAEEEPLLEAGQRAMVVLAAGPEPAVVTAVAPFEVEQALAWRSTQLVFRDTPLDEVVAAFNRYNSRQLVLGTPALRLRKITGVFRADNVEGFMRLLEVGADVETQARGAPETVLTPSR